jgi:hypothetical protein
MDWKRCACQRFLKWERSCHGPSAPWPARPFGYTQGRQTAARKKKPATPGGMTVIGSGKPRGWVGASQRQLLVYWPEGQSLRGPVLSFRLY